MSKSSFDKRNLIPFIMAIISLVLIIIGVIPVVLPLIFVGAIYAGFEGLMMGILGPVVVVLFQAIIVFAMYRITRDKDVPIKSTSPEETVPDKSSKKGLIILEIINLAFCAFISLFSRAIIYAPVFAIMLIVAPILSIVAIAIYRIY
ncbi:MAG: hypothetical protein ACFE9R_14390 [Candidatus Hermodarchaeota archaeon]